MSVTGSQRRTLLQLLATLRPHWRRDLALPDRIQALLASHRAFGSRDRRLYRELIYTTLRHLPWIEPSLDTDPDEAVRRIAWLAAPSPATERFRADFATGHPPADDRSELLPAWFRSHCPELYDGAELDTQLRRAPLWIRLRPGAGDAAATLAEFDTHGWPWRRSSIRPEAVEMLVEADLTRTESWRAGRFEVQDLGSQLLLDSIGIEPGGRWLDACAGAGGKTLQLAHLLGPRGLVEAHDIRPAALAELRTRATRAGLTNVRVIPAPAAPYDGILVDAPCSGSGTWRRSPHLKWITTEAHLQRAATTQAALLQRHAPLVRPGGRLVYATCSLSPRENRDVAAAFLASHPDFAPAPFSETFGFPATPEGMTVWPSRHDTDGFFVASFRRC